MRFISSKVSREHRYALGKEAVSGTHYISIPVANRLVDYEEYYRLSDEEYAFFSADDELAREFAVKCGRREMDDRLMIAPGTDRGVY